MEQPCSASVMGSAQRGGEKMRLGAKRSLISIFVYLSPKSHPPPHSTLSAPVLDQVDSAKPEAAQRTILPSTKPGATKERVKHFQKPHASKL